MSERRDKLNRVLLKHFGEKPGTDIEGALDSFFSAALGAKVVQGIRAKSRRPEKDREAIAGAAKGLRRAERKLAEVGIHGGQAIHEIAVSLKSADLPPSVRAVVPYSKAGADLAEHFGALASALEAAASKVDTDAEHFFSEWGEDYIDHTPPKELDAQLYRNCQEVFQTMTGKPPSRIVDTYNAPHQNSGAFIEFARDVFQAFGRNRGSADYRMDEERKQKSSQKK